LFQLNYINIKENIKLDLSLVEKISNISRGDLRKAINLLQNFNNLYDTKTNEKLLYEFSGFIPEEKLNQLFEYIFNKDMQNMDLLVNELYINGYSIVNQIILFHDFIIKSNLSDDQKSKIINKISEVDIHLINGCDEYIQFIRLVYFIISIV
jgi:DNA polymerase III delta prime subunit